MGKLIGCATVVVLIVGLVVFSMGFYYLEHPGFALGTLAPLPRDWGKIWSWWTIGGVLIVAPIGFMVWGAVKTHKAHPGLTLKEAIAAEDTVAAGRAAKLAGYVEVMPNEHSCSPPMFTGPRATIKAGVGSIWECPACATRWRLLGHEVAIGIRGKNGSTWGLAPKGK